MRPYFEAEFGNPSSIYELARNAKRAVETARGEVAAALGAQPTEIYFTGGGSESDNWAIKNIAESYPERGKHIITTEFEHHAVLHACQYMETRGYEATYLPVGTNGVVDPAAVEAAIRPDTALITIMLANNEIGTVQPIAEIAEIAKRRGVLLHTDAVQALGHVPINVKRLGADFLTVAAHKIYGPKGVGALYARKGTKLKPFIHGGAQERGRRAGTENVPGIVGFGVAARLVAEELEREAPREFALRERLVDAVLSAVPDSRLNGDRFKRLPGNANFAFKYIEGESILLLLERHGIFASSGSACTSGSLDPSHVLLAIGMPHGEAHGSLRVTIGRYNTEADIDKLVEVLPGIVRRLRDMSPLH
jgi:cysteine desulfurase